MKDSDIITVRCENCKDIFSINYGKFRSRNKNKRKMLCPKCQKEFVSYTKRNQFANMSDEQQEAYRAKQRQIWNNKSDEEKSLYSQRTKDQLAKRSEEEWAIVNKKNSEALKKHWQTLTKKEHDERIAPMRIKNIEYWNSLSKEEKSIKARLWLDNKSEEERSEYLKIASKKMIDYNNSLSYDEKVRRADIMNESNRNLSKEEKSKIYRKSHEWYHNLSEEGKKEYADNKKQWWLNLPDEKQIQFKEDRKQWWANLPEDEIAKMIDYQKDLWKNKPIHTKKELLKKMFSHGNGRSLLHDKFESFVANSDILSYVYIDPEVANSGKIIHSWDYGIFDENGEMIMVVDLDGVYFHGDDSYDYDGIHGKYEYDVRRGNSIPNETIHCIIRENHFEEDFQWLTHILQLSYDEFIEEEVRYLISQPFPYPSYDDKELVYSWNKLSNMRPDNPYYNKRFKCHLGDHIIYHFCHSLYDESVWDEEWVRNSLKSHIIYHPHMNKNKLLMCVPHEEFTPPGQARIMLKDQQGEYVDPNCDVGMMLGCIASHIPYRSTYTNLARYNEIEKMLQWLTDHGVNYDVNIYLDQRLII